MNADWKKTEKLFTRLQQIIFHLRWEKDFQWTIYLVGCEIFIMPWCYAICCILSSKCWIVWMHKWLHNVYMCLGVLQFDIFYLHFSVKGSKGKNFHKKRLNLRYTRSSNAITFVAMKLEGNYFSPWQKTFHIVFSSFSRCLAKSDRSEICIQHEKKTSFAWKISNEKKYKSEFENCRMFHTSLIVVYWFRQKSESRFKTRTTGYSFSRNSILKQSVMNSST